VYHPLINMASIATKIDALGNYILDCTNLNALP
jgi:hypothetical protein